MLQLNCLIVLYRFASHTLHKYLSLFLTSILLFVHAFELLNLLACVSRSFFLCVLYGQIWFSGTIPQRLHVLYILSPLLFSIKDPRFCRRPCISFYSIIITLTNGNCGNCCPLRFATLWLFVMPSLTQPIHYFLFHNFILLFLQSNFLVFSHKMSCHSLICALYLPTSYFVCTAFLRLL